MNKLSKCLEKCTKYDDRKKSAILCCKMPVRAKTRAHARERIFFIKCSIWPETYVKKNWDDLEHFKFLRARKRAHLGTFIDLKLTGRILILIVIIMNEKYFSVMKIWSLVDFHKMAPGWRHDDFESLKSHAVLS